MSCCCNASGDAEMGCMEKPFDGSIIMTIVNSRTSTLIEFVQQVSQLLVKKTIGADRLIINFEVKQDLYKFVHDRLDGDFSESFTEDLTMFGKKYSITLDNLHAKKFKLLRMIMFEKIKPMVNYCRLFHEKG